jgi:flagella basal body P-ring formation protein FlgA
LAHGAARLLLLAVILCAPARASDQRPGPVRIALKPMAAARGKVATIADLADIEGGDEASRQRVAALDVVELKAVGAPEVLSQRLVQIRLLLAGVSSSLCEVTGADRVTVVRAPAGVPDKLVVDAIQAALSKRFRIEAADLDVRLTQPLQTKLELDRIDAADLRLEPLLPAVLPVGRTRLQVDLYVRGQLRESPSTTVDIGLYQTVAQVVGLIGRGETLTPEKIRAERVRTVGAGTFPAPAEVAGRKVNRALRAGETIRLQDLESPRDAENPVLVKPRDTVQLVVRKGQLTVVLSAAEALQPGRQGDVIRVLNPDSKKIISGRVVSRSELEVAL